MGKNLKNIDNLFKEELGGYTETPPPAAWDALERRLDGARKKRVFPYRWLWYFSIVSFIVLLGASIGWKLSGSRQLAADSPAEAKHAAIAANTPVTGTNSPVNAAGEGSGTQPKATSTNNHHRHKHHTAQKGSDNTSIAEDSYAANTNPATVTPVAGKQYRHKLSLENERENAPANNSARTANIDDDDFTSSTVSNTISKSATHDVHKMPLSAGVAKRSRYRNHTQSTGMPTQEQKAIVAAVVPDPVARAKYQRKHSADNVRKIAKADLTTKTRQDIAARKESIPVKSVTASEVSALQPVDAKPLAHRTIPHRVEKSATKTEPIDWQSAKGASTGGQQVAASGKIITKSQTPVAAQNTLVKTVASTISGKAPAAKTVGKQQPVEVVKKTIAVAAAVPALQPKPVKRSTKVDATEKKSLAVTKTTKDRKTAIENGSAKSVENKTANTSVVAAKVPVPADVIPAEKTIPGPLIGRKTTGTENKTALARKPVTVSAGKKSQSATTSNVPPMAAAISTSAPVTKTKHTGNKTGKPVASANQPATGNKSNSVARKTKKTATTGNKVAAAVPPQQTLKNFNSSFPNTVDAETQSVPYVAAPPATRNEELSAAGSSNNLSKQVTDSVASQVAGDSSTRGLAGFRKWEAGIKGGYERGFNSAAANKLLVSPYVQYNLSARLSIMAQPAVKEASVVSRNIGTPQAYYKVNSDGKYTFIDSSVVIRPPGGGGPDTLWRRNYAYAETHDSVAKSYAVGGHYLEFELPILLKYNVSKKFSVYGGLNVDYSKLMSIQENTYTSGNILQVGSVYTMASIHAPAPVPTSTGLTYGGTSISNYTGPKYPSPQGDILRLGYMLGFSYEFKKRWLFDMLLQQCVVQPKMNGGYNTNAPLAAPYFRFTIGYKLLR